jgi:hypothetical protein
VRRIEVLKKAPHNTADFASTQALEDPLQQ